LSSITNCYNQNTQESSKEQKRVIYLSFSSILISIKASWITRVLKELRFSMMDLTSSILRWYGFFWRKNLFNMEFDWYEFPNFSNSLFVLSSIKTFNNTKYERLSWIIFLSFFLHLLPVFFWHTNKFCTWIHRNPLISIYKKICDLWLP
jgi:hypothetical protein